MLIRRLVVLVSLSVPLLAPSLHARPTGGPEAVTDSTAEDAMAWARRVVALRRAVEAAEAGPFDERPALAERAFRAALAVGEHATNASARALVLRAQAAYESHVGPVAALALGADEVAALRAEALAGLGSTFAPPLVSAAEVAARRAEAEAEAEALRAEADRRDGPAYLFYPAAAAALVERQRGSARRLSHSARRGRRLLRSMSRQLDRRGVPADLRYVAVIESALDPHAESWAGAQGLWQFMPETAAEYGLDSLSVSDPVASTDAAARYLRWLSRQLRGDWQLALAAYNCGIGRVQRLAREFRAETGRQPTFWDLHDRLPTETQHYVPRFIAVAEAMGARG